MKVQLVEFSNGKFAVRRKGWFKPYEFFYYLPTLGEYGWTTTRQKYAEFNCKDDAWDAYLKCFDKGTPV